VIRRPFLAVLVLSLFLPACTVRVGGSSSASSSTSGSHLYRIHVEQVRRGRGLADTPDRRVSISARVEERRTGDTISLLIKDVDAGGEPAQVAAARNLIGRSASLRIGPNGFEGISLGIGGDPDLGVGDVALLFQVISPAIPSGAHATASRSITGLGAPWADRISLDVRHHPAGHRWVRWVLADVIETEAKGTLVFKLPVAREAPSGGPRTSLVDDVFQSLFGYTSGNAAVDAFSKSIAAIPFAVAAPFLALADALGCLFGCSSGGPRVATLPLEGPIELSATTAVGGSDARELRTTGHGSMRLAGKLPAMTGDAAGLSGKPITLAADWTYSKELVKPWPFGALALAVGLIAANIIAIALVVRRRRRAGLTSGPASASIPA
jgi:hypothetical protein